MFDDQEPDIDSVHEWLLRTRAVAEVRAGGAEERSWLDCDLASLAENRLGDTLDPRALGEARRADWQARATEERPWALDARGSYERFYWLLEDGDCTGTIALAISTQGAGVVRISSFYVLPTHRGRGTGKRALGRLQDALARADLGLRLETSWCWQRAVRFYLSAGLWIYMWKRELTFCWYPGMPRPRIDVGERAASLAIDHGHERVALAAARRRGDALELEIAPAEVHNDRHLRTAHWQAPSTLALSLALAGWPLIRSGEEWDKCHYADGGAPESLAYKIGIWEAWAKKNGWALSTPRIPGIPYPTWEELEARWAAEDTDLESSLPQGTA